MGKADIQRHPFGTGQGLCVRPERMVSGASRVALTRTIARPRQHLESNDVFGCHVLGKKPWPGV